MMHWCLTARCVWTGPAKGRQKTTRFTVQGYYPCRVETTTARYKVVTTMGPKKPQRSSSTSEPSAPYFSAASNLNLFLETSFTSLHNPSSNSSITNGYYSTRSQPSPISIHQDAMTSISNAHCLKSPSSTKSQPSPILRTEPTCVMKSSLSLSLRSCTSPKVDLIHDDWLGLAPLASPESLSELSSISSRASLIAATSVIVEINNTPKIMRRTPKIIGSLSTCADDIRNVRNFQRAKTFTRLLTNNNTESSSSSNLSYESAASSNKCCGGFSNSSYKVIEGCGGGGCENSDSEFQSAEDILDNVLASAGCKDFFNSESNFLETHFDIFQEHVSESPTIGFFGHPPTVYPQVMSPCSPPEIDQDLISNLAIDLNLDEEHRAIHIQKPRSQSQPSSSVDSGSICRTPSDITKNVTFNPQVITVDVAACDTHYSPPSWRHIFRSKNHRHKSDPSPSVTNVCASAPIKTILSSKRRIEDTEDCFSRTEALPLLSGLSNSASERTPSPSFVRRKKYVYPSDVVVMSQYPNESTV